MEFILGLFRFFLFVDCVLVVLLVLIQLPKKDAGLGVAFGGAATDALFGAGAGNAITKITKWATVFFFVISLGLAAADSHYARANREKADTILTAEGATSSDSARSTTMETSAPATGTNVATAPTTAPTTTATNVTAPATTPATTAPAAAPAATTEAPKATAAPAAAPATTKAE